MKMLKHHANVITFLGYVFSEEHPILILEFCSNGDLLQFLRKNKHKFVSLLIRKCCIKNVLLWLASIAI